MAAAVSTVALAVTATPALASSNANLALVNGRLRSVIAGLCLDSNDVGDVYKLACNGGNYQVWTFSKIGEVTESGQTNLVLQIMDAQTLRCLDSDDDGDVYTLPCADSNPYQQWVWYTDGHNAFKDVQSQRCLDANAVESPVYTRATWLPSGCDSGYQMWDRAFPAQIGPLLGYQPIGPMLGNPS